MKTGFLLTILSLTFLFSGCSSTGSSVTEDRDREGNISENELHYNSLADFLRNTPGLSVSGSGENVLVRLRGINSFNTGVTPLYIIDGQPVGTSYSQANSLVDPRDIDYVKVLKGPETSAYGMRGANGVIEIFTKKV